MDLSDLIDRHAAFTPGKTAIRFQGRTLTYATFAARIAAAARALKSRLGIGRGDRVAILSTNHPDYLVLLYACARLGAVLVPLNWRLAVPEQPASSGSTSDRRMARRSSSSWPPAAATVATHPLISPARCSWSTRQARPAGRKGRCCARRLWYGTPP
jgi:acyl-CoA synthetase (AMP-forming)/AMP-acid ligase II